MKKQLKGFRGITLIALVITIIVLLILAGVSIAMLTGDNGILTKAQASKVETDKANEKEQIDLAVLNSKMNDKNDLSIDKQKLGDALSEIDGLTGLPSDTNYETSIIFPITVTGKSGTKYEINEDGATIKIDHSEVVVSTIAKTGVFANDNIEEVREGNIPIPTGYTYVKGDKKGGAVITDGTSEFVWIPVDTISEMAVLQVGSTTNYRGVLYTFNSDPAQNSIRDWSSTSTSNREPAKLTASKPIDGTSYVYDSQEMFTKVGAGTYTETMYQEEYNKMATSVAKYGGFYVGRYETSLNDATSSDFGDSTSTTVQSKVGVKSANASLSKTNMWYGLYKMSKTYAPEENTSKSVVSSMIWGSQYDAMMRWMQKNGIDVTEKPTSTQSSTLQNAVRNTTRVTGASDSQDKLNNIYDILGNSFEWTLEAYDTIIRVVRGGVYFDSNSPSTRNGSYTPTNNFSDNGSRLTLYIK